MKHSFLCKIRYALYSIPVRILCEFKGVRLASNTYWAGMPFISRCPGSYISIGKKCRFMSWTYGNLFGLNHRCMISTGNENAHLEIGDFCSFSGVSIWCFQSIILGDGVRVGANVTIMDGDAHQDDYRAGKDQPVVIKDNVWIGANVLILKGVTIGENSLIGAGSIVTKSIPSNVVAAGNPCRVIKSLNT